MTTTPTTPTVDRWFVRCTQCLSVAAIDQAPWNIRYTCGLCGGPIEVMGQVRKDRLVTEHLESVCDAACTGARGPICNCKCGGKNHGSRRNVRVITDRGPVPQIDMPDSAKAKQIAAEWQAAAGVVRDLLKPLLDRRAAGEFLPRPDFDRMLQLQRALRAAGEKRTHVARMKALAWVTGPAAQDGGAL